MTFITFVTSYYIYTFNKSEKCTSISKMVQLNPVPVFGAKKKIPVPFDGNFPPKFPCKWCVLFLRESQIAREMYRCIQYLLVIKCELTSNERDTSLTSMLLKSVIIETVNTISPSKRGNYEGMLQVMSPALLFMPLCNV